MFVDYISNAPLLQVQWNAEAQYFLSQRIELEIGSFNPKVNQKCHTNLFKLGLKGFLW
jgi:hypothetical protein